MKITCKKCEYEWDYQGSHEYWVTCPRCLTKIKSPLKNDKTNKH